MVTMVVKKSDKPEKKYVAVFTKDNGRVKKTYFGQAGADDYLKTGDKAQRSRYRQRHKKDLKTNDYTRAGYLSYYLLWGADRSLQKNIFSYTDYLV